MTVFLVLAVLGAVVLLTSLIFGDLFGLSALDMTGGWISAPVIALFIAALGVTGATASANGAGTPAATAAGLGVGAVLAVLLGALTRGLAQGRTDSTPDDAHLIGLTGTVVSAIPDTGYGRVSVMVSGQPMHLNARAPYALGEGSPIFISQTLSSSAVMVEPLSILPGADA